MSNQPNQPPKSAEEILNEFNKSMFAVTRHEAIEAMQTYASQFCRYVTDEEIDAMWPYSSFSEDEVRFVEAQREAAKAMRDWIFNNVKPKV